MTSHPANFRFRTRWSRLAAVAAAATLTLSLFSALILAFDHASPAIWLKPTPEILEMVAQCNRTPQAVARDQCRQHVAALWLERERQPTRVARR